MKKLFLLLALISIYSPALGYDSTGSKKSVGSARTVYSSTNVTTAAYVTILASVPSDATEIYVFDSSGSSMALAVFLSDCTTKVMTDIILPPGGPGRLPVGILAGSCLALKALSANATAGENDLTLFY